MNYKLAKQLKDAGFKQPIKPEERLPVDGIYTQMGSNGEPAYTPTLSELIEACMKKADKRRFGAFALEYRFTDRSLEGETWWTVEIKYEDPEGRARGKTPEEAVAELWLKLKK